jgi:hypothetical protein
MSPDSDLHSFYQFLTEQIERGDASMTPEVALGLWRSEQGLTDDEIAIEEALADMDAGDTGITLDELDRRFRERHGLPTKP